MNSKSYDIANTLLSAVKEKYLDDYLNIPEIRVFWHNTLYLFFSSVNCQRLLGTDTDFLEMVTLELMPAYLLEFYRNEKEILSKYLYSAVSDFFTNGLSVIDCRQEFLNLELDCTNGELSVFCDKVSRDSTGSYYTPRILADEVIKKSFADKRFYADKQYKIADFSCGGGDFFLAIMDYLEEQHGIDRKKSVNWFFGIDIDPIVLQICIVNLLQQANPSDWKKIISHFTFGNPLIICDKYLSDEDKNKLFATRRFYSGGLGLPTEFFEDTYDIIVGNPPWEKVRFEERKFFKGISNYIAAISQKHIREIEVKKLHETWPVIYQWRNDVFNDYSQITSKTYKHCKIDKAISGELNTYSLFTELAYNMLSDAGFFALIIKSTLVTAPAHKKLWNKFLFDNTVSGVYIFENNKKIFHIDSRERFVVIIVSKEHTEAFEFSAGLTTPTMLSVKNPIMLTAEEVSTINPFTNTIPNVSDNDEISFLQHAHKHYKLFSEIYPDCHFGRLIHLTAHAEWIEKEPSSNNTPIYEGKFIEQYDARYTTFRGMTDSKKYANKASSVKTSLLDNGKKELPESRYFVQNELWNKYRTQYSMEYSLCWRSLTSPTNRRTMLAMILPTCPTCQSIQMLQIKDEVDLVMMLALFNSIPFDYFVRIKMPGIDLTQTVIKQIPVPSNEDYKEIVKLNGVECSLKKHILSYTISLIKTEDRLRGLVDKFKERIYEVEPMEDNEKKKMIDLLFKKAYHLNEDIYQKILLTFPKYQEDHTF